MRKIVQLLNTIDRRFIYLLIILALAVPLICDYKLTPAPMETANAFYAQVNKLDAKKDFVLISADWGPSTQAENKAQTEIVIEHLMRKGIPFGLISILPYASPFLINVPKGVAEKLEAEDPKLKKIYGKDWINFGYQPGASLIVVQGLAKAKDYHEFLRTDANGTPLSDFPIMQNVKTIKDISMLMEFTGTVGAFNLWLQYFQANGYQPPYLHGCTSISIPDAYNYFISKQIKGLHEGIAGASWYEEILTKEYPGRKPGSALRTMTGISVAHIVIILCILLGNISELLLRSRGGSNE
jgi:hypothetical protein